MKIKTEWNLKLLYKSPKDPQIEKDMQEYESACAKFAKKYSKKDFIKDAKTLKKALDEYYAISELPGEAKPWWYFALAVHKNSQDKIAQEKKTQYHQRLVKVSNSLTFFTIKLSKIDYKIQKRFLTDPVLSGYTYHLENVFSASKYLLSEKEENIESLLSESAYGAWVDGHQKELFQRTVQLDGREVSLSEASSKLSDFPKKKRDSIYKNILQQFNSTAFFAESEINAIVNYKKNTDELRGFKMPYSSRALADELSDSVIEIIQKTITENFSISKTFYKLHSKLLGLKKLSYCDKNVPAGKITKKFNFDDAVAITDSLLLRVNREYSSLFHSFLEKGQIDVYPKKGKYSGGYSWTASRKLPTFILLNQTDNIRSLQTLAHEMGHSIHSELSRKNPPQYSGYSFSCAEVASTFFEQLAYDEIEPLLSKKEKIIFLHDKIMGDISTIFRQIAAFNFECELHSEIRKRGNISKDEIASLMNKHMLAYLGPAFQLEKDDGYTFVGWTHIRDFFYVYSYAFGQLVSRALYEEYKKDTSFASKIHTFLSAGSTKSPVDIFKDLGIDITDRNFYLMGLKSIEKDIKRLAQLTS